MDGVSARLATALTATRRTALQEAEVTHYDIIIARGKHEERTQFARR